MEPWINGKSKREFGVGSVEEGRELCQAEKDVSEQRVHWVGDWTGCPVISPVLPVFLSLGWKNWTGLSYVSVQYSDNFRARLDARGELRDWLSAQGREAHYYHQLIQKPDE